MHLGRVDIAAERNIKEILKEIDKILSQLPPKAMGKSFVEFDRENRIYRKV